ncbi:MAG: hypothetical protein LBP34_07490 [Flavobacteriaceae bacterium]|jgi:hypothetical protein|nr:hypothetical protein [Flavobacteriaceae bacterium]
MKISILLNDLSENKIDKIIANENLKAAGELTFCWRESFFLTFINGGL